MYCSLPFRATPIIRLDHLVAPRTASLDALDLLIKPITNTPVGQNLEGSARGLNMSPMCENCARSLSVCFEDPGGRYFESNFHSNTLMTTAQEPDPQMALEQAPSDMDRDLAGVGRWHAGQADSPLETDCGRPQVRQVENGRDRPLTSYPGVFLSFSTP